MYAQVEKPKENKSSSVANSVTQKKSNGKQGFGFVDKRPETIAQRKLQEMVDNSSQEMQLKTSQGMANNSSKVEQVVQLIGNEESSATNDASGTALLMLIDELQKADLTAKGLADKTGIASPSNDLDRKSKELRRIAQGNDEDAKTATLTSLRAELGKVGPIPSLEDPVAQRKVIQKVGAGAVAGGIALALGVGYLARLTYQYIRDRREDRILADYYENGAIANPGIPLELSAGIAALPNNALKAARLFQNVNNFRFRYTGNFVNPVVAYSARQGDCQTLVGLYQNVALAQGIPFAVGNLNQRQLVAPRAIHGRNTTANTEGNTDWYFREHYWAIGAGTAYDVLFMVSPPPASIVTNGNVVHNGVTYYTFADGRCVIEPGQAALGYEIQGEGRVFANAAATIAFINAHP